MSLPIEQALPSGARIDSFEIKRVLGTGGFGITYEAYDWSLDCQVAIKEYFPSGLATRGGNHTTISPKTQHSADAFDYGLKRFLAEARTLAKFQEPNVVRVSRFLEANGTAYLVMDYEDGRPLADVIKRLKRLDEKQAKAVVANILKGLQAVHQKRFLHRDIKPANILIRRSGPPVLLDFGAARVALEEQAGGLTVMLTPGYAPIEQYSKEEKQGPWSDIYAMGATAFHCITGKAPPPATDRLAQSHHGLPDPAIEILDQFAHEYSPEFIDAVKWMMELLDVGRPRTAGQALAAVLGRVSRVPTETGSSNHGASKRDRSPDLGLVTGSVAPTRSLEGTASPRPVAVTGAGVSEEALAAAEGHLAGFLGPIAKLLVQRASPQARDIEDLYERLAEELDRNEREAFLQLMPNRAE